MLSRIKDGWVIAFLVMATAGMAFWAAQQAPTCDQEDAHSVWDAMPWALKLGVGQLALAGGLMLWSVSRRFVPPQPYVAELTRTRGEYLNSIAQLWQRAGASKLALEQLELGFRRELAARLAVPANANRGTLLQAAKQRWPEKAVRLDTLLQALSNAQSQTTDEKIDNSKLHDLAYELARFRKEIER